MNTPHRDDMDTPQRDDIDAISTTDNTLPLSSPSIFSNSNGITQDIHSLS